MRWVVLTASLLLVSSASAARTSGTWIALVTAEQQNQLVAVDMSARKVMRRVSVPADPQNVAVGEKTVVVVSTRAGAVTLLDAPGLRIRKVFRGLSDPHVVATSRSGQLAYVTAAGSGQLVLIDLVRRRIVHRIYVGGGAHHMALSPTGKRLWIALGERAARIAIVDLSPWPERPRVLRRFSPGFVAHDLTFTPDGRRVWVTSGVGDSVHALNARTGREAFAVRVGPAPQHVAFIGGSAFATSGYGNRIVKIDARTGRRLKTATAPPGSFHLSTFGSFVVTTSLLEGVVTKFDDRLHPLMSVRVGGAARSVALTVWKPANS